MAIDVHRDSDDSDKSGNPHTVSINGAAVSTLRFCVCAGEGMSASRQTNVRYSQTKTTAENLKSMLNSTKSGFVPKIYYKGSSLYNQDIAGKYGLKVVFVEVGYETTPTAAALSAMPYLASALNKVLKPTGSTKITVSSTTTTSGHAIMGASTATAKQLAAYALGRNSNPKLNCTVEELAQLFINEGNKEGVRGDIAFCQALLETGFFKFGGIVKPEQNNYGGIGAFISKKAGYLAQITTPLVGVAAHRSQLKTYTSTCSLFIPSPHLPAA